MLGAMRASRLVSVLLILQTRGRMTAAQLAQELEVSERTIHRDVDALSVAGVPIYAERGPHGGVQLVDGYRTRLTGMTGEEAEALFLSGLPGPAAELGLGTVVAAARLKVLAALPPELRARASRLVERFHLDAAGWFHAGEAVPHLATLSEAVWESERVRVSYDRGDKAVERVLEPLGLVLKAGIWYLVARVDDQVRTYRISRVESVERLGERFARPDPFDLAGFWAESIAAYERDAERVTLKVRVRPERLPALGDFVGHRAAEAAERLDESDAAGWIHLRLVVDWPAEAPYRLLGMGADLEVLEPPEIRDRVVALARSVLDAYAASRRPRPVASRAATRGAGTAGAHAAPGRGGDGREAGPRSRAPAPR
jgi:predicted DNA-binding transcriptional regulator YafY